MGLETATYVASLNSANPAAADQMLQGDDHIRLLKAALQATFPGASKAFYFPTTEAASANDTLLATEDNKTLFVDCTSGAKTFTLPTLTSALAGWQVNFVKVDTTTNLLIVAPASGTINGAASARTNSQFQRLNLIWTGTAWYAQTIGPQIGSMEVFAGTVEPPGYVFTTGQALSRTTYAALFAHIGVAHGAGNGSTTFNAPNETHPDANLKYILYTGVT